MVVTRYANDNTIKLNAKRKKEIAEYLKLNESFVKLRNKGIVTFIIIDKLQEEIDIDKLEKDFDISKCSEENKKLLPKIDRGYLQFLLLPFTVYEGATGKDRCIDNFDTGIIQLFNERIKIKIDTYKDFLK